MKFPKLFSRDPEPAPPPVCTRCGRLQDGSTPGCDPQAGALCYGFEALAEGELRQPRCPGCQAWQAGYHHADCPGETTPAMTRSVLEVAAALVAADDQMAATISDYKRLLDSNKQRFLGRREKRGPRHRACVCWAAVRHGRRRRRR